MTCTRCNGTGFLNIEQLTNAPVMQSFEILEWVKLNRGHDVTVCDCCGN